MSSKWGVSFYYIEDSDIVSASGIIHKPEKFIRELHRLTTYVKVLTISYGSILQCFCVGINDNFTMSVPLTILPPLAADFDGNWHNYYHYTGSRYNSPFPFSNLWVINFVNCWKLLIA